MNFSSNPMARILLINNKNQWPLKSFAKLRFVFSVICQIIYFIVDMRCENIIICLPLVVQEIFSPASQSMIVMTSYIFHMLHTAEENIILLQLERISSSLFELWVIPEPWGSIHGWYYPAEWRQASTREYIFPNKTCTPPVLLVIFIWNWYKLRGNKNFRISLFWESSVICCCDRLSYVISTQNKLVVVFVIDSIMALPVEQKVRLLTIICRSNQRTPPCIHVQHALSFHWKHAPF